MTYHYNIYPKFLLSHYSYVTGLTIIEPSILIRPWSSIGLAKNLWTTWRATIWNCRITVRVTCTAALLCTQTCIAPTLNSCNVNILSMSILMSMLGKIIIWLFFVAVNEMYFYFKCIPCVTGLWVDVVAWFGLLIGILIPTAFKIPCCTSGFVATALIPVEISPASGSLFGWLLLLLLAWLRVPSKSPRLMRTENRGHHEFHLY